MRTPVIGGGVVVYDDAGSGPRVEVVVDRDSVWLSLNQIADVFQRDKSVISRHLKSVFDTGELEQAATVAENAAVQDEGDRSTRRSHCVPTLWEEAGFIFRFRTGDYGERPHVHVTGHGGTAKTWLRPVELEKSHGYSDKQIGRILGIAGEHEAEWLAEWEKRCGSN